MKDNYGTRIDGQDGDSWTTRLGLRVDGKLYKGSRTVIQPFAEANWLHTSDDVSVSFDDATVKQDLPANRAELKWVCRQISISSGAFALRLPGRLAAMTLAI